MKAITIFINEETKEAQLRMEDVPPPLVAEVIFFLLPTIVNHMKTEIQKNDPSLELAFVNQTKQALNVMQSKIGEILKS
jgi:hypothetical protein